MQCDSGRARALLGIALLLIGTRVVVAQTPEADRPSDRVQAQDVTLLREDFESLGDVMVVTLRVDGDASELARIDRSLAMATLERSVAQRLRAIGVQVVEPIPGTLDALNVPTLTLNISTTATDSHFAYLVSLELSRLVHLSDLGKPQSANPVRRVTQARTWRASSYGMSTRDEGGVVGESVAALVEAFCQARARANSRGW